MNKTAIETADYTWNPVSGCNHGCSWCYARKIALRFYPKDMGFAPHFYPERLSEPAKVKKPSKIFTVSMGDLFGDWVPAEWIIEVLRVVRENPRHIFQFLTKNPKRLQDWYWPPNCWVGTTVTNQADADERLPWLLQVDAPVRFVSHEPLLSGLDLSKWVRPDEIVPDSNPTGWARNYCGISWAIIGATTGPGAVKPEDEWVGSLIHQYRYAGIPIFLKNSLYPPGAPATVKIREFPDA